MAIIISHVCAWQWFWQSYCCSWSTHGTSHHHHTSWHIQSHFEHVTHKMCEKCGVPNVLPSSARFPLGSVTAIAQRNGITAGKGTDRHLCKGHLQTTNASQVAKNTWYRRNWQIGRNWNGSLVVPWSVSHSNWYCFLIFDNIITCFASRNRGCKFQLDYNIQVYQTFI